MAVWRGGSVLILINEVNLRPARLVLGWVTVSGFDSRGEHFINQVSRLAQPYPLLDCKMSTSQRAVMLCGWGVKAGMA